MNNKNFIEKARFPDYRYEFDYIISKQAGDYFLDFSFFGPELYFSQDEIDEICGIIGVEVIEWTKPNLKAKITLSFPENSYKTANARWNVKNSGTKKYFHL